MSDSCPSGLASSSFSLLARGPAPRPLSLFFFCFFIRDRVSPCNHSYPGTHSVRPGWPRTHRSACSASQVLGLKACATTARQLLSLSVTSLFAIHVKIREESLNRCTPAFSLCSLRLYSLCLGASHWSWSCYLYSGHAHPRPHCVLGVMTSV